MAYFSIPKLVLPLYPFDYHSHFSGVLPVDSVDAVVDKPVELQIAYTVTSGGSDGVPASTETVQAEVNVEKGQALSLVGLFGLHEGKVDRWWRRRGTVSLFVKALQMMVGDGNPFARLGTGPSAYQRGECAAENVYIACLCVAARLGVTDCAGKAITDGAAYQPLIARINELQDLWWAAVEKAEHDGGDPSKLPPDKIDEILPMLGYFNGKIYSASKYTPFDDAYTVRWPALEKLRDESPQGKDNLNRWYVLTLMYLQRQGVVNSQLAIGTFDIPACNAFLQAYNAQFATSYKLLAHTSSIYLDDARLKGDLEHMLPKFADKQWTQLVGIDLLGTENKVGGYATYFQFLLDNRAALLEGFGDGGRARTFVSHIHCGEGTGVAADNRSAIGYAMAYSKGQLDRDFYERFADYVEVCANAARKQREDNRRGTHGTPALSDNGASGLFDELFRYDSLTYGGLALRRYDSNSAHTRQLVAYAGKRNMMALSEALQQAPQGQQGVTFYQKLVQASADAPNPLSFRLGHAYYYRSYIAERYKELAFDTNLGSNAITGASGLFDSLESYRGNRGLRHLRGYADTDLIQAAIDRVMFSGLRVLSESEVQALAKAVKDSDDVTSLLANCKQTIQAKLQDELGPILSKDGLSLDQCWNDLAALFQAMVGTSGSKALWYDALARIVCLFANWRSYLLGADGQGVEHTDIQRENVRCVLLLAYSLVPFDTGDAAGTVAQALQTLVGRIGAAYWAATVGEPAPAPQETKPQPFGIDGYKAPASVVTIFPLAEPA